MLLKFSWERDFTDNVVSQIGEAQTGDVGDAADDSDVERGKSIHPL